MSETSALMCRYFGPEFQFNGATLPRLLTQVHLKTEYAAVMNNIVRGRRESVDFCQQTSKQD